MRNLKLPLLEETSFIIIKQATPKNIEKALLFDVWIETDSITIIIIIIKTLCHALIVLRERHIPPPHSQIVIVAVWCMITITEKGQQR